MQQFIPCTSNKNGVAVPVSEASELSITHIWYSIHTSPCCTSFNFLSQVPFTMSHKVSPAGQFLSVGSLSLGLAFMKTTVNMLIWTTQSHCGLTRSLLLSFIFLYCVTTITMFTPRQCWKEAFSLNNYVLLMVSNP